MTVSLSGVSQNNARIGALAALSLLLACACERGTSLLTEPVQTPGQNGVATEAGLSESEKSTIAIFENASPSVVQVITLTRVMGNLDLAAVGSGSGFIWDRKGHVVTNNHVVDAAEIIVQWPDGTRSDAQVAGRAPNLDIAVLELTRTPKAPPLAIGNSAGLKVGQSVFAIGNPFGLDGALTTGVVSALERRLPARNGRDILGVIQTDAAINPGNSGGPLLDSAGRVIGVTTAMVSPSGASSGVGFAVPIDQVARAVQQLIEKGRVATPGIGILSADETTAARLGLHGVLVWRVFGGSAADRAGLRGANIATGELGDVITAINGKTIVRRSDLMAEFDKLGIGARVDLSIMRQNRPLTLKLAIEDVETG